MMWMKIKIEQHPGVIYLDSILDETRSIEFLALRNIKRSTSNIVSYSSKEWCLFIMKAFFIMKALSLLIQPCFWLHFFSMILKTKPKAKKKKLIRQYCICFYLNLDKTVHILRNVFKTLNSLILDVFIEQIIKTLAFKRVVGNIPSNMDWGFGFWLENYRNNRNRYWK